MNDVLALLWQHTYLVSDSTVICFSRWCSTSKIDFMTIPPKRKLVETGQKISTQRVFAPKHAYIGRVEQCFFLILYSFVLFPDADWFVEGAIRHVVTLLSKYQEYIKGLQKNGRTVIGYTRKSKPKTEDYESRIKLLQRISNKL